MRTLSLTKTLTCRMMAARIARSEPGCSTCPVAVAIWDRGFEAAVGDRSATVSVKPGVFAEYRLPRVARNIVRWFGWGWRVAPATFRISRID